MLWSSQTINPESIIFKQLWPLIFVTRSRLKQHLMCGLLWTLLSPVLFTRGPNQSNMQTNSHWHPKSQSHVFDLSPTRSITSELSFATTVTFGLVFLTWNVLDRWRPSLAWNTSYTTSSIGCALKFKVQIMIPHQSLGALPNNLRAPCQLRRFLVRPRSIFCHNYPSIRYHTRYRY